MIVDVTVDRDRLRRTTAPHLLCERARSTPDSVAFRSKHFGIYRERRWRDYAVLVARATYALQSLGIVRGERVAIMGDVCEEWMICDLAAQSLGVIVYGIYPTASAKEVDYQMRDGGACVFIAEDQEYVDRILPIADQLPDLRAIVVLDDSAMFGYEHAKLHRFSELLAAAENTTIPPLSSIPPALLVIRKVRWSPTESISPRPIRSSSNTRPCARSSTVPSSIYRCATCSGATSLLRSR